jgi:hypothetical protein
LLIHSGTEKIPAEKIPSRYLQKRKRYHHFPPLGKVRLGKAPFLAKIVGMMEMIFAMSVLRIVE